MATGVFAVQRSKLIVPIAMDEAGAASRARRLSAGVVRSNPEGAKFQKFTVHTSGANPLV